MSRCCLCLRPREGARSGVTRVCGGGVRVRRFREIAAAAVSCFWKEEKMVFDSGPIDLRSTHNNKLIAKVLGKSDGDTGYFWNYNTVEWLGLPQKIAPFE